MSDSMHPLDESLNKACREISGVNRALDEMMVAVDHTLSDLSYAHAREDDNRQRAERAEAERDALAAHVERLRRASENALAIIDARLPDWTEEVESLRAELDNAPDTSLERLKAQWQAEELENSALHLESIDGCNIALGLNCAANELNSRALELRRQAGGDA